MGRDRKGRPSSPFTRRQQLLSTVASVAAGFAIMAATKNVIWGFVTFMLFGVLMNALILFRQKK